MVIAARGLKPTREPAQFMDGLPFVARLASFGDRVALRLPDRSISYQGLAQLVSERATGLGTTRRLVMVAGASGLESLVTYLAAMSAGHPVILVPGDNPAHVASIQATYDPDVVAYPDGALTDGRPGTRHDLHPELALLLSTSGSTGSPKLVRLSAANLQANAESIAQYLAIRATDVAATTLPMHYCYGLSVINSHLLAGASLMLTSLSVVDARFWELSRLAGVTTFAAVPYTVDLLDRVGFERMELPSLRYVTLAGGRLAAERVRGLAEVGRRQGWDLFVMYGQTEATARMAYLPPQLALTSPESIGVPIPGGAFRLEPLPDLPAADPATAGELGGEVGGEVGELVYEGPNVMLGYAESPADLALGRVTHALRTGDVARRAPSGLYEIVGRRNRFAKILGLRVDLDQVERLYAKDGVIAACAIDDMPTGERLVVAICDAAAPVDVDRMVRIAREQAGLPATAVAVCPVHEIPRLPTGKTDYPAVTALPGAAQDQEAEPDPNAAPVATAARLRRAYAEVLRREVVRDEDSFVTLEGDSLSYVELSLRVERLLGHLPPNWHLTPIGELVSAATTRRGSALEVNVLLRAVAIVAIVGSHANLFVLLGGAHVLLAVAGFNFGRFHLTDAGRGDRLRHMTSSVARIAVPSAIWIGLVATFTAGLDWKNTLLLNGVLGSSTWMEPAWHYWFIEALVYTLLGVALLMALPVVDTVERRWPFWLPMTLAFLGLLTRYQVVDLSRGDVIHRAHIVFWLFALGWATVKASSSWQRVMVSVMVVVTVPGFFDNAEREMFVIASVLALVWLRSVRVPSWAARIAGVLASASLYIYLSHWQVYPHLEHELPWLATALSLVAGIAFWQCVEQITRSLRRLPHVAELRTSYDHALSLRRHRT